MKRPMVTVGIPFLTAIGAVFLLPAGIEAPCFFLIVISLLLSSLFLKDHKRAIAFAVFAAFLAGGLSAFVYEKDQYFDPAPYVGQTISFSGHILENQPIQGGRVRYLVSLHENPLPNSPKNMNAYLYAPDWQVELYDEITVQGKILDMPQKQKLQYHSKGVFLVLSSYGQAKISSPSEKPVFYQLVRWNQFLSDQADHYLEAPYNQITKAILLGRGDEIEPEVKKSFAISGIAHILVVSGLHLSLLSGIFYFLLRRIGFSGRFAAVISVMVLWLFAGLTGCKLPVMRSGIMTTLLFTGKFFRRPADSLNSLFWAAILLLLPNPILLFQGSFQLSFTATLGAIFATPFTEQLMGIIPVKREMVKKLFRLIGPVLCCLLTTLPVMVSLFGGISLVSPLTNLLILPLLPVILVLSLLTVLSIPFLSAIAAIPLKFFLFLVCKLSDLAASLPFSWIGLEYEFVPYFIALIVILCAAACLLRCKREIPRIAVLAFLALLLMLPLQEYFHQTDIFVLSSESAYEDYLILTYKNQTMLLDFTGGKDFSAVEKRLRNRNRKKISCLVLLGNENADLKQIQFLEDSISVERLILNRSDPLKGYFSTFPELDKPEFYSVDDSLILADENGISVKIFFKENQTGLILTAEEGKLCPDPAIFQENCKFFFKEEQIEKKFEKNQKKYGILINNTK